MNSTTTLHDTKVQKIKQVCESLEKKQIGYAILRNYQFLLKSQQEISTQKSQQQFSVSEKQAQHSIDLIVAKKDFSKFDSLLKSLGFHKRTQSYSKSHHPYFCFIVNQNKQVDTVSFDVQVGGVHWNDICYLQDKDIIANRIKQGFFYVPNHDDTFVMLVLHSILGKRYFKEEYKKILEKISSSINKDYVLQKIQSSFSKNRAKNLLTLALHHNWRSIIKYRYSYILSFISQNKTSFSIFFKLLFRWIAWKKPFKAYPLISFIGPDGAGKSTASENLLNYLQQKNKKAILVYTGRGRNHILPIGKLGRFYKHKEKIHDLSKIHGKKQAVKIKTNRNLVVKSTFKRKILYSLAAPIFTLDLLLRYFFMIFLKRHNKTFVITDRYTSDILLVEHTPLWLRKLLFHLSPKPTLTFYIYNDAQELQRRRPEETLDGLQRQLNLFEDMGRIMPLQKIKSITKEETSYQIIEQTMTYVFDNWY